MLMCARAERSTEQRQLRGNSRCNAPFEHDVVTIGRVCVGEPDSLTLRGESEAPHQDEYRRQNPKAYDGVSCLPRSQAEIGDIQ